MLENITLQELKAQRCVHITAEDLLNLCDVTASKFSPTDSPEKKTPATQEQPRKKATRHKMLVIDIRPREE